MADAPEFAARDSWPSQPANDLRRIPSPRRSWTDDEWMRIRQGLVPSGQDDKWFAFVEGDRLFIHRSATGYGIYEAQFRRQLTGWNVMMAMVENDPARYARGSDEWESQRLEVLIDMRLLGLPAEAGMARLRSMGGRGRAVGE
jgi:hypothetical protein